MESYQSEQITELVAAIVKAQLAMVPAVKDHVNPYFKSKYADLPSCWEATAAFRENGIAITQSPMPAENGCIVLDTQLSHASGQWMRSRLMLPVAKQDPQGYGSAITYARRYAIGCMCGIVTEEDDDGNAASHPPAKQPYKSDAKAKIAGLKFDKPAVPAAGNGGTARQDNGIGAGMASPVIHPESNDAAAPSIFVQSAAVADWSAVIADTNDLPGLQKHWETITKDARLDSTQKVDLFKVYQKRVKEVGKKK